MGPRNSTLAIVLLVASLSAFPGTQQRSASAETKPLPGPLAARSSPGWVGESNQRGAFFGYSVAGAGDVNGDGYGDVIVGAVDFDNGQTDEGRAYAYYGSAAGLSTTPNWTAESNQEGASFGFSVAGAGDVNGDGYDDVIVGARDYSNDQAFEGRAFVYYGSAAGLSTVPNWTGEADQSDAGFGDSVAGAGDLNGDGYDDVLVGAALYDHPQHDEGRAFLYFGSAAGLSTIADWTAESDQDDADFANSVGGADVNGDGYDDVIVGAEEYDHGQSTEGRAYAYYGSPAGPSATPDWIVESNQEGARLGASVAGAGDVNGDGYDDVIVGADLYDDGQTDEGGAFAYYGSAAGLSTAANWTAEPNQSLANFGVSVSSAGDVNGDGYGDVVVGAQYFTDPDRDEGGSFTFCGSAAGLKPRHCMRGESNQAGALFGSSVANGGDVNGDGYDDSIVGAFEYDHGQIDEGAAFLKYGSPG